jgi:hypothetical protein
MRGGAIDFEAVSRKFRFGGNFLDAVPIPAGHINDTYLVRVGPAGHTEAFVLQRINTVVFRDPDRLMENIVRITEHVAAKVAAAPPFDGRREVLRLIPTREGRSFFRDSEGRLWRAYNSIGRTRTVDVVEGIEQAWNAAWAFGRFQEMLADLPEPRLHETIPHFHDTPHRFAAFLSAVETGSQSRAAQAKAEIEFAAAREDMTGLLTSALAADRIPERVTHNDTKINNVLFDTSTGEPVCVIDLDITMAGAAAYDFGDLVRTSTSRGAEDERDLRKVRFQLDLFEAVAAGFLEAARDFLTPLEVDSLVVGGKLITFETGLRFLTDFLEGDVYFKTARPAHNLDRARTQFELVRQLEEREDQLSVIVERFRR